MISYLRGKVKLFKWGLVILDVGGVGYKVSVSPQINIANDIVDTQEEIELFIHQHLREDADDLYGFSAFEELELFDKLISVNGVGPKAGMNIMSVGQPEKIISAIINEDVAFFTTISGIGKKAALKIIVDLKSKLGSSKELNVLSNDSEDVVEALLALGYKRVELQGVIGKMPHDLEANEDKVKWCLKNLGRHES